MRLEELRAKYKESTGGELSEAMLKVAQSRFVPDDYELNYVDDNIVVYYGVTMRAASNPIMMAFKHRAKRAFYHKVISTEERRDIIRDDLIGRLSQAASRKSARREAQKAFEHNVKVGDIFYSSWGYDQTNINWYQVVATTKRTVTVKEISSEIIDYDTSMSGHCRPVIDSFIQSTGKGSNDQEAMRRVVSGVSGSISIRIDDVQTAWLWDGKAKHWTSWA